MRGIVAIFELFTVGSTKELREFDRKIVSFSVENVEKNVLIFYGIFL